MLSLILVLLVGASAGAALGYVTGGLSGKNPAKVNWQRGALAGAILALLLNVTTGLGTSPSEMNQSTANVTRISQTDFDKAVLGSTAPVVVDFYATWCGPCRLLSPRLDQAAAGYSNTLKFVKVNLDEAPELARTYQIEAIPTLLFFRNGKLADRLVGLPSDEDLKNRLDGLAKP